MIPSLTTLREATLGPQFDIPEEIRHDFRGVCWWCGIRPADSKEHRYKKSDLTQVFGKGAWHGDSAVVRGGTGVPQAESTVQGPNSKRLKFEQVLCQQCNNDRSQPFDLAYSGFTAYMDTQGDGVLASSSFRFSDIYGADWKLQRSHFIRYLIKHMGCRFAELGIKLPSRLVRYLNSEDTHNPPSLRMGMEIRLDIAAMEEHLAHEELSGEGLWIGDIGYHRDRRRVTSAFSFLGYTWLRVSYEMDRKTKVSPTNFDGDLVVLPTDYNIDPDVFWAKCAKCNGDGQGENIKGDYE